MKRFGSATWNGGLRDPKPGAAKPGTAAILVVRCWRHFSDLTVSQNEGCSSE